MPHSIGINWVFIGWSDLVGISQSTACCALCPWNFFGAAFKLSQLVSTCWSQESATRFPETGTKSESKGIRCWEPRAAVRFQHWTKKRKETKVPAEAWRVSSCSRPQEHHKSFWPCEPYVTHSPTTQKLTSWLEQIPRLFQDENETGKCSGWVFRTTVTKQSKICLLLVQFDAVCIQHNGKPTFYTSF